jgi:hypothetical protein
MKLTDTQLVLLSAAAQRDDAAVEIGPRSRGTRHKGARSPKQPCEFFGSRSFSL